MQPWKDRAFRFDVAFWRWNDELRLTKAPIQGTWYFGSMFQIKSWYGCNFFIWIRWSKKDWLATVFLLSREADGNCFGSKLGNNSTKSVWNGFNQWPRGTLSREGGWLTSSFQAWLYQKMCFLLACVEPFVAASIDGSVYIINIWYMYIYTVYVCIYIYWKVRTVIYLMYVEHLTDSQCAFCQYKASFRWWAKWRASSLGFGHVPLTGLVNAMHLANLNSGWECWFLVSLGLL